MKVGVVVGHTKGKTVDESFRLIVENGFDNCQLVSWDSDLWNDDEAGRVKDAMARHGVTITAFWCGWRGRKVWDFYEGQETLGIVPPTYRYARMRDLINGADFAKKLGVIDVVTHAGYLPENPFDPNYAPVLTALREVAGHYKTNGQNFLFETGQETPVTLLRVIEEMGTGNAYVNLDPANLILYGKANPVDALDVFGKYVRGVHAKDGMYPTCGRELGREVPLGEGKANIPVLVEKLRLLGYDGALTIEREIQGDQQLIDILNAKKFLEGCISRPEQVAWEASND